MVDQDYLTAQRNNIMSLFTAYVDERISKPGITLGSLKYSDQLPSLDELMSQVMKAIDEGKVPAIPYIVLDTGGEPSILTLPTPDLHSVFTTLERAAYNDYLRVQQTKPSEAPEVPPLNITAGTVVVSIPVLK